MILTSRENHLKLINASIGVIITYKFLKTLVDEGVIQWSESKIRFGGKQQLQIRFWVTKVSVVITCMPKLCLLLQAQ